jgi:protein SHQ1
VKGVSKGPAGKTTDKSTAYSLGKKDMPITPRFSLSQTDTHIIVDIDVPHVRVSVESVQVVLENNAILHFASPPYLLLLNFQEDGEFEDLADEDCATYLPEEHGKIRLQLKKKTVGEWKNLDMIGRLVRGKTATRGTANWVKEVVGGETESNDQLENPFCSTVDQGTTNVSSTGAYGFARMFHGIFTDLGHDSMGQEMFSSVWNESEYFELGDAYRIQRREERLQKEQEQFSAERYLGDLDIEDDYLYQCAMAMLPHWKNAANAASSPIDKLANEMDKLKVSTTTSTPSQVRASTFSAAEQGTLASIPYPLLPADIDTDTNMAGLCDILYAYAYDHLLTDGDPTVESAWTISILSASLSWLEECYTIQECVKSSLCRTLVYPYIRNLEFGLFVWKQVEEILQSGPVTVIRCLLQTRDILHKSEFYYLGNKLYVDPYLAWIQKDSDRFRDLLVGTVEKLYQEIDRGQSTWKGLLGLGLYQLEASGVSSESDESACSDSSNSSDDDSTDDDSRASNNHSAEARPPQENGTNASRTEISKDLLDENLNKTVASLSLRETAQNKETSEGPSKKLLIEEIS